jgi:hypothetical protein
MALLNLPDRGGGRPVQDLARRTTSGSAKAASGGQESSGARADAARRRVPHSPPVLYRQRSGRVASNDGRSAASKSEKFAHVWKTLGLNK